MPTTCAEEKIISVPPSRRGCSIRNNLPSALSPGQRLRAGDSLMMSTGVCVRLPPPLKLTSENEVRTNRVEKCGGNFFNRHVGVLLWTSPALVQQLNDAAHRYPRDRG